MSDRPEPSKEEEEFFASFEEEPQAGEESDVETSDVKRVESEEETGEKVSEGDKKTIYLPREINMGLIQAALDQEDMNQSQIVQEALQAWLEREGYQ